MSAKPDAGTTTPSLCRRTDSADIWHFFHRYFRKARNGSEPGRPSPEAIWNGGLGDCLLGSSFLRKGISPKDFRPVRAGGSGTTQNMRRTVTYVERYLCCQPYGLKLTPQTRFLAGNSCLWCFWFLKETGPGIEGRSRRMQGKAVFIKRKEERKSCI